MSRNISKIRGKIAFAKTFYSKTEGCNSQILQKQDSAIDVL